MQAGWLTGLLSRTLPLVRDRLLADPRFLFLVIAEMLIDSGQLLSCLQLLVSA